MLDSLTIGSPKRKKSSRNRRAEFFPYYAGFPEEFAATILRSSALPKSAVIYDPWNGSGTTTYAAAQLGYATCGVDLNPVMVLVARARAVASTEADSIVPQAKSLTRDVSRLAVKIRQDDPLLQWFDAPTGNVIRSIEFRIRNRLVSSVDGESASAIDKISLFASIFYVALFTVCRSLTASFRSSNPTWLKTAKNDGLKLSISAQSICAAFVEQARQMATSLADSSFQADPNRVHISLGNSIEPSKRNFADMILTSPPYCTRIDYTAATLVELAVIAPLLRGGRDDLSKRMIGSVKVPTQSISPSVFWGSTCLTFLEKLYKHSSKASKTYYYKTHLDYFDKIFRSIHNLHSNLKQSGSAILVVQDSYYKDLHNDVPAILSEMAQNTGFELIRREDFTQDNSLVTINSRSTKYRTSSRAIESVICLKKK